MEQKHVHQLFEDLETAWGSFDDFPALLPGIDPMPHLSRNTVSQPFFLTSDRDQTLINLSGEGAICFAGERRERMQLVAGDCVYLPAGVPSRILTQTPSLQVRFKADTPGREAVAWYCADCDDVVYWQAIDAHVEIPQETYWEAVGVFNADATTRTCASCGAVHAEAELGNIAWPEVVKAIRSAKGAG